MNAIGSRSLVAKNLSRFKLITFDVTDTLLRFSRPPEVQYAMAARRFGFKDVNENGLARSFRPNFRRMAKEYPNFGKSSSRDWHWWWRTLVMDIFRDSHRHMDEPMLERIASQLIEDYKTRECWTKIELADQVIRLARENCRQVGIISNFDPRLGEIVSDMRLPQVDFILTSYEAGASKPSPEIFAQALDRCRGTVSPSEALHIGNTPKLDYVGARNAGWSSVLVNVDVDVEEEMEISQNGKVNSGHVFRNFADFISVLETVEFKW
ncbi:rhythmically expressed gene 2 protein-like [Uranotaenia lowii]|uniref:rhythmically expressed gene 2 protein-like n=1 Tax=Uranotaenia lowii TaxID=190385 RepID=UPI00247AD849|nr:rhythmically expressed gene 2 protein-like [Uranotaenia lowii]XP_055587711.1 rhythmically expressed gene 2 protein-like [Uranotaenia lowii]XP_055587712.1 rhythmically expressed gene 2 protein-like [Uranotaenia lowii]